MNVREVVEDDELLFCPHSSPNPQDIMARVKLVPPMRDQLHQIASFLQRQGFGDAARAIVDGARAFNEDIDPSQWGQRTTYEELWQLWHEKRPAIDPVPASATAGAPEKEEAADDDSSSSEDEDSDSEDETEGKKAGVVDDEAEVTSDDSSDEDSSSDSDDDDAAPAQTGTKRKREVTPDSSSEDDSTLR